MHMDKLFKCYSSTTDSGTWFTTTVKNIATVKCSIKSYVEKVYHTKGNCYSGGPCDGWESGKRFTTSAVLNQTWYRFVQRSNSSHGHKTQKRLRPDQRHLVLVFLGLVESVAPSPPVEGSLPDEPEEGSGECRPSPSPVTLIPREIEASSLFSTRSDLLPSCSMVLLLSPAAEAMISSFGN